MASVGLSFPRYVDIETTHVARSAPLFQGSAQMSRDARPAKIMTQELFDAIVSQIAGWKTPPDSIFLNMNGEPLQDPNFSVARRSRVTVLGTRLSFRRTKTVLAHRRLVKMKYLRRATGAIA